MNKKLITLISAVAVLAPASAFAMPIAVPASSSFGGAKIERTEVIVRTGPRVVRRAPVVIRRAPIVRRPAARIIVR